jgi:arylsulfatase A-like enzyme
MFPIYNRRGRNFDLSGARDYFDNLALVDRTVGELRAALEKAGLWDRTALLITADHGFRPDAWRGRTGWTAEFDRLTAGGASLTVPLILKLPGRPAHAGFDAPISNVVSADLVLAVLSGEVATAAQATDWLDRHAAGPQSLELQSATAVLR